MMLPEEEDDVSSECSSGCQSGWTAYLDHSSSSSFESPCPFVDNKVGSYRQEEEDEDDEEDLSMVSDASSGPPHFHGDDEHSFCFRGCGCLCSALSTPAAGFRKKRRVEPEYQGQQQHSSLLDDTASSPLFSCPKISFDGDSDTNSCIKVPLDSVLDFPCSSSATHCKKKYAFEKQMGFLQSSAASAKQTSARPVSSRKEGGDGRSIIPSPNPQL